MKKNNFTKLLTEETKKSLRKLMAETSVSVIDKSETNDTYTVTDDIIYLPPSKKDGKGWEKLTSFNKRVTDPTSISSAKKTKLKKGTKLSIKTNNESGNKVATLQGGGKTWNIVKPSSVSGTTLETFLTKL